MTIDLKVVFLRSQDVENLFLLPAFIVRTACQSYAKYWGYMAESIVQGT